MPVDVDTTTIRDWPIPTGDANGRGEGWVSAKGRQGSSLDFGQERLTRGKESELREHPTLNLNLSLDKHLPTEVGRGQKDDAPSKGNAGTIKFGGKGAGQGTARAKRPFAVQP